MGVMSVKYKLSKAQSLIKKLRRCGGMFTAVTENEAVTLALDEVCTTPQNLNNTQSVQALGVELLGDDAKEFIKRINTKPKPCGSCSTTPVTACAATVNACSGFPAPTSIFPRSTSSTGPVPKVPTGCGWIPRTCSKWPSPTP